MNILRRLRLVEFTKEFVEPDWCQKDHIGYALSGEMEINFDGKLVQFRTGDGIYIPSGEKHKHIAAVLTDRVRLILIEEAHDLEGEDE